MIDFPNAKINLGLNIVGKRPDGYHNIQSCFFPAAWSDVLEIVPAARFAFSSSGIDIPGEPDTNLVVKAWQLLHSEFGIDPVKMHLHKLVPIGAGLGGGSADGAFALKMLNTLFKLGLTDQKLQALAGQMGSDCPFFIKNEPAYVTGTGHIFSAIDLSLKGKWLVLLYPGIHISTAEAYRGIQPRPPQYNTLAVLQGPVTHWKEQLVNDFEEPLAKKYPRLRQLKQFFYEKGAFYAAMTGSGSAVYGIFNEETRLQAPEGTTCWQGRLAR